MFATIDIGTNSVLLLIGEPKADGTIHVIEDRAVVTGLGRGASHTGIITQEAMGRTLATLGQYLDLCSRHRVSNVAIVGTAVLRNAGNADEFLSHVKQKFKRDVDVITGKREAHLTYLACVHDFGRDIVVMDIGGGSTELIADEHKVSLPIGCVSGNERFLRSDPVTEEQVLAMRSDIRAILESNIDLRLFARPHDRELVGVAGTATTVGAMHLKLEEYDASSVHGLKIRIEDLRDLITEIKIKTINERKNMRGLIPERADVILAGSLIFHETMSFLGYTTATISDHGVKWGLFYELVRL